MRRYFHAVRGGMVICLVRLWDWQVNSKTHARGSALKL